MPLAEVKQIPRNNLRDVSLMMRKMADQIEAGEWGAVDKACFVMAHELDGVQKIQLYILGDTSETDAYLLLNRAANKIL